MRALQFQFSIPRMLVGKALGWATDAALFGGLSGLSLKEMPEPSLPGPDWARLEVVMCGVCGSDLAGLTFKTSAVVEPFLSLPAVLGHEVLARVAEVGPGVTRAKVGDLVAVDPTISCIVRDRAPAEHCASCATGLPTTCARGGETGGPSPKGTSLARGLMLGANADLPGGFSECIVAHNSQLFPVPASIDANVAVLTEPMAIGVHAVLQSQTDPGQSVLVIGSGPIAFAAIWALRALGHSGPIIAQTKRAHEAELAKEMGASDSVPPGAGARSAMLGTGAIAYQPIVGPEVYAGGGFPVVFDCMGTRQSLDQALRFTAPRGKINLLGSASEIGNIDLTFLWAREIQIEGFVGYGMETWRGERLHTFEVTHRLMQETDAPLAKLVTHRFPLERYRDALRTAVDRRRSGAIKIILTPR